jgi:hypothetical protein
MIFFLLPAKIPALVIEVEILSRNTSAKIAAKSTTPRSISRGNALIPPIVVLTHL